MSCINKPFFMLLATILVITQTISAYSVQPSSQNLDQDVQNAINLLDYSSDQQVQPPLNNQPVSLWTCIYRIGRTLRQARQFPVLINTGLGVRAIAEREGCPHLIQLQPTRQNNANKNIGSNNLQQRSPRQMTLEAALTQNLALPRGDLCPKDSTKCISGVFALVYAYFCISMNNPVCCLCLFTVIGGGGQPVAMEDLPGMLLPTAAPFFG